jgi:hypothetical protein
MTGEQVLSLSQIRKRREAIQHELADLDAAERLLTGYAASKNSSANAGTPPSIKLMILRVLSDALRLNGLLLDKGDILQAIRLRWLKDFKEENLPPKLSLYKHQGLLKLDDGHWGITDKGTKELEDSMN